MLKYLFVAVLFCSTAFAADVTESVSLEQKGKTVKVIIIVDGGDLVSDFGKAKTESDAQRTASLADKTQIDANGNTVTVKLTQEQKDFVNTTFDLRADALKRTLQLNMLDKAAKALQTSMQRAAYADADVVTAKAAEIEKINASYAKKDQLKPVADVEAVK